MSAVVRWPLGGVSRYHGGLYVARRSGMTKAFGLRKGGWGVAGAGASRPLVGRSTPALLGVADTFVDVGEVKPRLYLGVIR